MASTPNSSDSAPSAGPASARRTFLGRTYGLLMGLVAVGAFGLWVWFVVVNWGRLWARVTSFSAGPGRASKLEVAWMLVGWVMGPVFAVAIVAVIVEAMKRVASRLGLRSGRGEPGAGGG